MIKGYLNKYYSYILNILNDRIGIIKLELRPIILWTNYKIRENYKDKIRLFILNISKIIKRLYRC